MPEELRRCTQCGDKYRLTRDKPGKIYLCWGCGARTETEARVGGNMVWTGKQAPELEIKSMKEAKKFAAKTRRLGAGVTASIITSKKKSESELFGHGQWMADDSMESE